LPPSLGEAPVGADDTMPWEVIRRSRKNVTHKARRLWIDVAICADKPGGNRTHPADDARGARVGHGRGPASSTVHVRRPPREGVASGSDVRP
jgi:hypothetical protein